ncbi:Phosphatidylinositol-4-phosphate 5-kinase 4 [Hordeum vulgare]|nr:Phosphatidylinositol-4-phosphate 5-kinase 4 [Hordeum vulgare]
MTAGNDSETGTTDPREEIDKWLMAFFWVGKEKANGGLCLVAWDKVCRPTFIGGLGVKDMRLQAIALRVR